MGNIRRVAFVSPLDSHVRKRHEHTRIKDRVTSFAVQIELFHKGAWAPVVRYDTSHGFAHRDLFRPDGRIDKTPLFLQSYREALDFAEADLRANWRNYEAPFLKEP